MNSVKENVHLTRLLLIILFVWPVCRPVDAQEFGRFRPGIQWQQINTPDVRVIFPKGLEDDALRVARNLNYISRNSRSSIGPLKRKLDLVINNQGAQSNGWVTVSPFRSEFYTTPPQDAFSLGSIPWLDLLSMHEYRHALQYTNLLNGWNKVAWLLFGDTGWGTMINLTTPRWFLEGDAVATETALSLQGRGRMPSFHQLQKSILGERKPFSYMKARNGSYRDDVPDEYQLGYLLCSYGRENFGNGMWSHVIRRTTDLKGIIYPFSDAVEALTGMNTRRFYRKAMSEYGRKWAAEASQQDSTPMTRISATSRTHTDYLFPVVMPDGELLAYKKSYKEPGRIISMGPDGTEKLVCRTGISQDPYFTASGNLVTWSELTWDPRYSAREYSDVVVWHRDTGSKTFLTRKQRYFSPALSPDGTKILVAEVDDRGICRLKILETSTGSVVRILPNPDSLFYSYPKWDPAGGSVVSSARTREGLMRIVSQSLTDERITLLLKDCNQIIGEVLPGGEELLFASDIGGTVNIYALSAKDGALRQLTGSRYGAYHPASDNRSGRLYYSDFDRTGYRLVSAATDSLLWKPVEPAGLDQNKEFDFNYFTSEEGPIAKKISSIPFQTEPYRQGSHLFRVHSWSLATDFYSAGINLSSDNTLNNLHADAGLRYYFAEKAPGIDASVSYGGLFPVLTAGVSRYYRHTSLTDVLAGTDSARLTSIDNKLSLEAEIPLDFSKGEWFIHANFKAGYSFISTTDYRPEIYTQPKTTNLGAVSGQAGLTVKRKQAYQNLSTPLGFGLDMSLHRSVYGISAGRLQVTGDFAVRGFYPNHTLLISAGWKRDPFSQEYHFPDEFIYPRGYVNPLSEWMLTFQTSYSLPLLYPDFGLAGLFYFSRIRTTLFSDFGIAEPPLVLSSPHNRNFASAGAELIFDTKLFNLGEVPLGIRFSLLLSPDLTDPQRKTRIEFVMPIMRL